MQCFGCGGRVEIGGGERVAFRDACPACARDLHVCANCAHHDAGAYNQCREPDAERVADRERANRCEYFRPGAEPDAGGDGRGHGGEDALAAAEALFRRR